MNNVFLVGRLGDDPKNFAKDGEQAVVSVSMATNEYYTDKSGNKIESTDWHSLIVFGSRGESFLKNVKKGDKIVVFGKINYKKYLKSNGEEAVTAQIVVDSYEFLTKKP